MNQGHRLRQGRELPVAGADGSKIRKSPRKQDLQEPLREGARSAGAWSKICRSLEQDLQEAGERSAGATRARSAGAAERGSKICRGRYRKELMVQTVMEQELTDSRGIVLGDHPGGSSWRLVLGSSWGLDQELLQDLQKAGVRFAGAAESGSKICRSYREQE